MTGDRPDAQADRLLEMLEGLLALDAITLDDAMTQAAQRLAEALDADKVDVLLHDRDGDALVAIGTSQTPMGRKEQELGLDRLPIAEGGRTVEVLRTGTSHLARHSDLEGGEPRPLIEELGIRSSINVALEVAGERRGVLLCSSATPEFFAEGDLRFVEAVARWIALVGERAARREADVTRVGDEAFREAAVEALAVLTRRQQEIAGLVAEGLTNTEIARRLVLTPGTVANHMEHILRRLNLRSRTQVGVWAVERGLYRSGDEGGDDESGRA
jgi:DNA-binding CsgD family transcriptional regulator